MSTKTAVQSRRAVVLATFPAFLVSIAGLALLTFHGGTQFGHKHSVHGFQVAVDRWQWMSHDMFGGPAPKANNFPMPAQMMPGMQTNDVNRLHVEVTVRNQGKRTAPVSGEEFSVETSGGRRVSDNQASDGSGGAVSLENGMSASLDLYFDVPLKDKVSDVVFTASGHSVRIPFGGSEPQHSHGY
jgi:hypothetical protein